jgi:thiol-disulfide isomerase/thioredoxin
MLRPIRSLHRCSLFGRKLIAWGWLVCSMFIGPVAVAQELSLEEFRRLHDELRQRMSEDLGEAEAFLEDLITKTPDSSDLNVLRESLASRWAADKNFDKANLQLGRLLDFQIAHLDQDTNRFGIPLTIQAFEQVARESGNTKALGDAIDRGFAALSNGTVEKPEQLIPLAQLTVVKAQALVEQKEGEEPAQAMVRALLERLSKESAGSEELAQAWIRTLRSLSTLNRANDVWRDECMKQLGDAVSQAMDAFPDSIPIQTAFAEVELLRITQWEQDDPEATQKRIDEAALRLDPLALKNRAVGAILRRILLHRERMEAAKSVESLVGKAAPDWDIDAWVNVIDLDRESLKGKVVLIDFWAMWCGPCIATFPHLREWREEFADDGFEIVGVTQYYNFRWDDETSRPTRAEDQVDPQEERQAIDKFLQQHQLKHPVMVTPESSEMSKNYGVRGIPHVVLLDRDGVVQLVKTGAGQATAEEIKAKIQELLRP